MAREPQQAVEDFVEAWGENDFDQMIDTVQTSWRIGRNRAAVKERKKEIPQHGESVKYTKGKSNVGYEAKERLVRWFGDTSLRFAEIQGKPEAIGMEEFSDVMVDVPVQIAFKDEYGKTKVQNRVFRVICEDETGSPTPDGEWKVNPVSVFRGS